jgi:hypothetical protein
MLYQCQSNVISSRRSLSDYALKNSSKEIYNYEPVKCIPCNNSDKHHKIGPDTSELILDSKQNVYGVSLIERRKKDIFYLKN